MNKFFLLMVFMPLLCVAQSSHKHAALPSLLTKYNFQTSSGVGLSTSGYTPLWQKANNFGTVPNKSNFLSLGANFGRNNDSLKTSSNFLNKFKYSYGFESVLNVGATNQLLLPQLFLNIKYGIFEVGIGRKREFFGLNDSTISSGSYVWSGNALPMPKLSISIPEYVSLIGRGFIAIKGSFSHGWFGNQEFAQGFYLHQKTLYGRVGRQNQKLNFYSGFSQNVQWGGFAPAQINNTITTRGGYFASGFNEFLNIAFPIPFIKKNFPPNIIVFNDAGNASGNQLGSVDFAAELKLEKFNILAYRQVPYELGSLFTSLVNADDGLYGIALNFKDPQYIIKKVVLEGLHTNNEGEYRSGIARLLNIKDKHFGESHVYLNHGAYWDGWSYNKNGIGTPFILKNNQIATKNLTDIGSYAFAYNRVKSLYFATEGQYKNIPFGAKLAFAEYKRTNKIYDFVEYPTGFTAKIPQTYLEFHASYPYNHTTMLKASLGIDQGEMTNNGVGLFLNVTKTW